MVKVSGLVAGGLGSKLGYCIAILMPPKKKVHIRVGGMRDVVYERFNLP